MVNLKYELCIKGWRDTVDLTRYTDTIIEAIEKHLPSATSIVVEKNCYSYQNPEEPNRGELIAIRRYISYNSGLGVYVKEYESKNGKWLPARKLFKRVI